MVEEEAEVVVDTEGAVVETDIKDVKMVVEEDVEAGVVGVVVTEVTAQGHG